MYVYLRVCGRINGVSILYSRYKTSKIETKIHGFDHQNRKYLNSMQTLCKIQCPYKISFFKSSLSIITWTFEFFHVKKKITSRVKNWSKRWEEVNPFQKPSFVRRAFTSLVSRFTTLCRSDRFCCMILQRIKNTYKTQIRRDVYWTVHGMSHRRDKR